MAFYADRSQPSIIIALDVGTVNTGAAYCIRESEDEPPIMRNVTRWGRNPRKLVYATNAAKIPSALYYDSHGDLMCAGAETLARDSEEKAHMNKWTMVRWFNLYIHSIFEDSDDYDLHPEPLPCNKKVEDIFTDFYKYLTECVFSFIHDAHPSIAREIMFASAKFVLTIPSAWTAFETDKLEDAMARAMSSDRSFFRRDRLSFVDNERAILHYCLTSRLLDHLQEQSQFTIADFGGAFLNFASFTVIDSVNQRYRQSGKPKCILQGSEVVTLRACNYLRNKLRFSNYGTVNDIMNLTRLFDREFKIAFSGEDDLRMPVAGSYAMDAKHGVHNGRLTLKMDEVFDFFKDSLYAIGKALVRTAPKGSTIFIVGAFSDSPYIRLKLTKALGVKYTLKFCDNPALRVGAIGALYDFVDSHLDEERPRNMFYSP